MDVKEYDALIMVTPNDFTRVEVLYERLLRLMPVRHLVFVGSKKVKELVLQFQQNSCGKIEEALLNKMDFICEDDILPFDQVHTVMKQALEPILHGQELPRGVTGWYYQQFLKMQYAYMCQDDYYMVWDGDTVPCKSFSMFKDGTDTPYLDLKTEYHEEYFVTLEKILPGMKKVIQKSFIAEHMLIAPEIMKSLIQKIEANENLAGARFFEKIIYSIGADKLMSNSFSEFETYGTFVALTRPNAYRLREWHSFRYAGEFFEMENISEDDFEWLSKDFFAASFEKNHTVREDHKNLFTNKEFQKKLSARKMLEEAQKEFGEGSYQEVWDDRTEETDKKNALLRDIILRVNEHLSERNFDAMFNTIKEGLKQFYDSYELYYLLGYYYFTKNINQSYLCFENALHYCDSIEDRKIILDDIERLKSLGELTVKKTRIVIVSFNQDYMQQKNIESIRSTLPKDSYEIVVVDNASTDGVLEYLEKQKDITLIRNEENRGFPVACNQGVFEVPNSEDYDIYLLNNDARLAPNALFWLRMGLYESENVGATGSLSNYAGNRQQVDVEFELPTDYINYGTKINVPMDEPYEERVRLSGFSMLIRAGLWEKVGGMDAVFSPGYFEDDDLCMKLLKEGYSLNICKNSFIYHTGSQSFAKRDDLEQLLLSHHKLFIEKYGFDILQYAYSDDENLKHNMIGQVKKYLSLSENSY